MGHVICGTVKPERTMKGERCGTIEVAAAMTIIGTLASVATGAVASASGVRPKPAMNATLSREINSCARRLVVSGVDVSSRTRSSSFWPATVSPCLAM